MPVVGKPEASLQSPDQAALMLESIIEDDRAFRAKANETTRLAWAVSLYLANATGKRFMQYVQKLSKLAVNEPYSGGRQKHANPVFLSDLVTHDHPGHESLSGIALEHSCFSRILS